MKKLLIPLIIIAMLLCSCEFMGTKGPDTVINIDPDENENENENKTDDEQVDGAPYDKIERHQAAGYKTNYYSFKNDADLLRIKLPTDWSLSKTLRGFNIIRDGKTVGQLVGDAQSSGSDSWEILKEESHSVENVEISKYIEQKNSENTFRYRYVYKYTSSRHARVVTLTADCAEISKQSEEKLYTEASTTKKIKGGTVGALSEQIGTPKSILILGNSFIGSSDIGSILKEMLRNEGRNCNVQAISRGYANVGTYTSDSLMMDNIRKGSYDAVFICGFYDAPNVQHLGLLKQACDQSKTELVIFPAHNESQGVITSAKKEYPDLFCLDWKAEIDFLINRRDVDRWDMCIDDMHAHSTPLAGYVGAHMIYRAIYGELPTQPLSSSLSQGYIDSILGNYAYVGDGRVFQEDNTTYLD